MYAIPDSKFFLEGTAASLPSRVRQMLLLFVDGTAVARRAPYADREAGCLSARSWTAPVHLAHVGPQERASADPNR